MLFFHPTLIWISRANFQIVSGEKFLVLPETSNKNRLHILALIDNYWPYSVDRLPYTVYFDIFDYWDDWAWYSQSLNKSRFHLVVQDDIRI